MSSTRRNHRNARRQPTSKVEARLRRGNATQLVTATVPRTGATPAAQSPGVVVMHDDAGRLRGALTQAILRAKRIP